MSKCLGCGVELQDKNPNDDGYVCEFDLKFCLRCFRLKNYGENRIVNKTNKNYMSILNNIKQNDNVFYVASLLTMNLDYIDKFSSVTLVLTKRDVIPKSVKDGKIINYIKKRYSNVCDVFIVSAKKKNNLDTLYNKICRIKNGNIYFVGATNSGKSTLINQLASSYSDNDGNITMSAFPSTTLDTVPVKIGDVVVIDTPGIVNDESIINLLDIKDLKKINSKKEIKPVTFQISGEGSIIISNFFRIDYKTNESSLTFYMSNDLSIKSISRKNDMLISHNKIVFESLNNEDIVIDDVGFIKITKNTDLTFYYEKKSSLKRRDNLI